MDNSSAHRCIFCLRTDGGFQKEAHVIPESAGNEENAIVLPQGGECDRCNAEFSPIEQPIIRSFPGQIFRVAFVKKTGRGDKPTADIQGGKITRVDSSDGPTIQILRHCKSPKTIRDTIEPEKFTLLWKSTQSLSGRKLSAFLAKIGLGYFCRQGVDVYSSAYDHLRTCAKSVDPAFFIPVFIGVYPGPDQNIQLLGSGEAIVHETRPVLVTFPGFAGIIPTAQYLSQEALRRLESFVRQNVQSPFFFITDAAWSKPIEFEVMVVPATEEIALQYQQFPEIDKSQ
jgi:hypothetical protein